MKYGIHGSLLHRDGNLLPVLSLNCSPDQSWTDCDLVTRLKTVVTHDLSRLTHARLSIHWVTRPRGCFRNTSEVGVDRSSSGLPRTRQWSFGTKCGFVSHLSAVVTYDSSWFLILVVCNWQVKLRMGKFTLGSLRTKSYDPILTNNFSQMSVFTGSPVFAEASVVPKTYPCSIFWVQMEKLTLAVTTNTISLIKIALGHFAHVVCVEELAVVSLLAEASNPMLTHNRLFALHVAEGTQEAPFAQPPLEEVAHKSNGLVHAWKREGLSANLVFEGILDVELDMINRTQQLLHI